MFFFRKRPRANFSQENAPSVQVDRAQKLESSENSEVQKRAEQYVGRRLSYDWMEDVVKEHEDMLDHLPGKGKPLEIDMNADIVSGILKNANVKPPWIELQHEIRDGIQHLLLQLEKQNLDQNAVHQRLLEEQVVELNRKISRYNEICPHAMLQKPKISLTNIARQFEKWN